MFASIKAKVSNIDFKKAGKCVAGAAVVAGVSYVAYKNKDNIKSLFSKTVDATADAGSTVSETVGA